MHMCVLSCYVMSNSLGPHGLSPIRLNCPGIFQARILEWVAISSSRRSCQPRDRTPVYSVDISISCISRRVLYHWVTCWLVLENLSQRKYTWTQRNYFTYISYSTVNNKETQIDEMSTNRISELLSACHEVPHSILKRNPYILTQKNV